ncbi:OLC1v1002039C7 [Oldenlandia corymbosa var. corymbosa]|uniref:OLC1v1002039C7 n=1 Tax=Oldenlandia corymbosa var. corymbosa TaxID=529605 RepID=A0AAV1D6W5_OLDCO|nr:OLC1v1002039C7 [Oldenlandia corymbosa var. corymbosa]
MDKFGGFGFDGSSRSVKRKRSIRHRHPQDESPSSSAFYDHSSLASTPLSDSMSKASSEENALNGASSRSENVKQNISEASDTNLSEVGTVVKTKDERLQTGESNESAIRKLKRVKLKVGGVTHTLHTKTSSEDSSLAASSSLKTSDVSDTLHAKHKLISEDRLGEDHHAPKGRESLRGIPWKDFSKSGIIIKKPALSVGRTAEQDVSAKHFGNNESSRKSKRVPKRRLIAESFEDEEENSDDEIRYLEKVRGVRYSSSYIAEAIDEEGSGKQRSLSGVIHSELYGNDVDMRYNSSTSDKESNKSRSMRASEDSDYFEDEELLSDDDEPELKKKRSKEFIDVSGLYKEEMAITTRQRALKSGRAYSSTFGSNLIEFPHGLPPAPPKKPKEKLSEVEQQVKKAEAAQRRRMQQEKAAQEAEAEAIRKILGQDSSRKKQEDKLKKRQEELAQVKSPVLLFSLCIILHGFLSYKCIHWQERAAKTVLPSNSVRWVIGPSGTTVTFPDEIGLPSILESKPLRYNYFVYVPVSVCSVSITSRLVHGVLFSQYVFTSFDVHLL